MQKAFLICFFLITTLSISHAQKTFSGTVYANSEATPLAGVSITVKGGVGATITDDNGVFSLQSYVKTPTLIFNYKGIAIKEQHTKKKKTKLILVVDQKYLQKTAVSTKETVKETYPTDVDNEFFPSQINQLSIKEDIFYSEKKKQLYRKISAITLVISGEYMPSGIDKYVATFDINELATLFKDNPDARWVNPFNPLQKSNFAMAFQQHWFQPKIWMYRHPVNDQHIELYSEEDWAAFRNHYKEHGDLLKDVQKDWQQFSIEDVNMKSKTIKIPKNATDITSLWLEVNLKDSVNQGFMPYNRELSKLLIDAVKAGQLTAYTNEGMTQKLSLMELKERLALPAGDEEFDGFDDDGGWGDDGGSDSWGFGGGGNAPSPKKMRKLKTKIPTESSTESYQGITENRFLFAKDSSVSTFSIDVDRASYSNMRRFIKADQLPPKDAVRIEEFVNYFEYDYPEPTNNAPFAIHTEVAACPWNTENQLVQIGVQGKTIQPSQLPPMNLVFLLDVSGSMEAADKLPLLKESLKLLMEKLRPQDRVAIVVYAGAAGLVLPSTKASEKETILAAFDKLQAGGSTAGGEGILLAYQIARQHFIEQGNNRIVLATDGDFNVGVSSKNDLERLIEDQRKSGVFLTVLGFGTGNLQDDRMETLADKGNGNYAYIDNLREAKKVLVQEFAGTLFTIAKDVKIQVDFNPNQVAAYRLIGYENRALATKDFEDDTKDAGELGAGHTVTALYEIVPVGNGVLQKKGETTTEGNLLDVKLRYKAPDGEKSSLIEQSVVAGTSSTTPSTNLQFASNVAQFGMLLRNSPYKGSANYEELMKSIAASLGKDTEGFRKEFGELVLKSLQLLMVP